MIDSEVRKGTGVWIRRGNTVLIGLRNNVRGADRAGGTWCAPGGHVESGESDEACVLREIQEETSLQVRNLKFIGRIQDFNAENNVMYDTACFIADWESGEAVPLPEEFDEWRWVHWDHLPQPLFRPTEQFVQEFGNPLEIS